MERFMWITRQYGGYNYGAYGGFCSEASMTRGPDHTMEGSLNYDRTSISITISSDAEEDADMWQHCETGNGPVEDNWGHWLPIYFYIQLPSEDWVPVVDGDENSIYPWSLARFLTKKFLLLYQMVIMRIFQS
jgi:hypothetical protein